MESSHPRKRHACWPSKARRKGQPQYRGPRPVSRVWIRRGCGQPSLGAGQTRFKFLVPSFLLRVGWIIENHFPVLVF